MSQPPHQPYPGQPYPDQPDSGQPDSGQPYPEQQSHSGPPYQGQPYPGQPNPDVPQSVPPQPGFPFPVPPALPHGPQPGYPHPQYAQAGYPAPQPPKKSKVLPIVLVTLAVVLVLCVGGGTAVFLAVRHKANDIVDDVKQAASPTATIPTDDPTTPPPAESTSTISVVEPKRLGGRPKLTDRQFAGLADELKKGLADVPNAGDTVGALYGTPAKRDVVVIAGVEAPLADPEKELNGTFLGAGISGLKVTGITRVAPGSLGGAAKCGNASVSGVKMAMCSWADEGSVGWILWYFKSANSVKSEFPKLRAQIEKSS